MQNIHPGKENEKGYKRSMLLSIHPPEVQAMLKRKKHHGVFSGTSRCFFENTTVFFLTRHGIF